MRKFLFPFLIIFCSSLLLIRIFYLQVIDDSLGLMSDSNAIKIKYDYPERGYVYDRKGKLLVANQPSYDVMVIPGEVKEMDTLALCTLLDIKKEEVVKKLKEATNYSRILPSIFFSELSKVEFAKFQEKIRRFEGFYVQKRATREYQVHYGSNIFGYITQVAPSIIAKRPYYKSGDFIGMQGVEEKYEIQLRGRKGVKYILKDKLNREIGPYNEGKYDTTAVQGKDIVLSIDGDLQEYGELLMQNKRGGIIALEPKTGEILSLVTAPTYDPSFLVGREKSRNYTNLNNDSIAKPLYNRGLLAEYPPGSPFKIMNGLVALQEGTISVNTTFNCSHGFSYARGAFQGCHCGIVGPRSLNLGIYKSCNAYFSQTYLSIFNKYKSPEVAVDTWSKHVKSFGFGNFMGYDLPIGRKGLIPTSATYKKRYPYGGWSGATIVSNAIGQGEVLVTPIQLANMMAAVANEGYYYTPHIIKNIEDEKIDKAFTTKHVTTIDPKHFVPIKQGLFDVFNYGTAYWLKVDGIDICGKTGTSENFARINGRKVQLEDHSIFVAFAPKDNPKIAVAVFVENGGFGSVVAGPIAVLMIEKYLRNEITRKDLEARTLSTDLRSRYSRLNPPKRTATGGE